MSVVAEGVRLNADYEIVEHLSRSKTLDVYDVYSERRDCRCIAKALIPERAGDERARRRLYEEARLLLRLAHPHIVRAYELIECPEPVLILETLTGETLGHLIGRSPRRLPATELAFLGMHLCSALRYLHGEDVVHLDVKPSNVICDRGFAKLIDLSIARPPGVYKSGIGTRQYMAPEQVSGAEFTFATDAWGVGATLFHAATGAAPFPDGDQLERRAEPVRARRPRLHAAVADAIDAALDPEPKARPSIGELADAFDEAVPD